MWCRGGKLRYAPPFHARRRGFNGAQGSVCVIFWGVCGVRIPTALLPATPVLASGRLSLLTARRMSVMVPYRVPSHEPAQEGSE